MGLMDDLQRELSAPRRTKWDEIKETLTPEEYKEFLEALDIPAISQAALRRALHKRGIRIGVGTISELRREHLRKGANK
jgi:hypothetical protein